MRVSKVDRRLSLLRDLGMFHHLSALVIGYGETQGARYLIELVAEANGCRRGSGTIQFHQG